MTIFLYQLAQACPHNVLHVLVALHAIISGSVMVWKMTMRVIWQVSGEVSVKYYTLYLDPVRAIYMIYDNESYMAGIR